MYSTGLLSKNILEFLMFHNSEIKGVDNLQNFEQKVRQSTFGI